MAARRYGDFRSDEVFCRGRRQYIPVGLTAASMRPTSLQNTSPDRNGSVTHWCNSQYSVIAAQAGIHSVEFTGIRHAPD